MLLNPLDLTDRRFLVTGASSGIGRATAQLASQLGARIALVARNEARLIEATDGLAGTGHTVHPFDLADLDNIPGLVKGIASEGGALSGLFHAAGISALIPVSLLDEQRIEGVLRSSLEAALLLTRGFCQKGVRCEGVTSLVLMSSAAARQGWPAMSVYAAAKAGIEGAVRALACELAPIGIRVNAIAAGTVRTELTALQLGKISEESRRGLEAKYLLGFGEPEDVACTAVFLLSRATNWITGTVVVVDGGCSCH